MARCKLKQIRGLGDQFRNRPAVIRNSRFHGRGDPHPPVQADESVGCEPRGPPHLQRL